MNISAPSLRYFFVHSLLLACLILAGHSASAQVSFTRSVGGHTTSDWVSAALAHDGGYVLAGTHGTVAQNSTMDIYLYKFDPFGTLEWSKRYGGSNTDIIRDVKATPDGGFVMAGNTLSFSPGGWNYLLIKVDSLGNVEWSNTYDSGSTDYCWDVQLTSDSGFVMSGHAAWFTTSQFDGYVVRVAADVCLRAHSG